MDDSGPDEESQGEAEVPEEASDMGSHILTLRGEPRSIRAARNFWKKDFMLWGCEDAQGGAKEGR